MTLKRLQPILFAETAPNLIGSLKQCCLIAHRSFRCHARGPSFRAAAGKNLTNGFLARQLVPANEYLAHTCAPSVASFSRNSATRLPATAPRYRCVERISSMAPVSFPAHFLRPTFTVDRI